MKTVQETLDSNSYFGIFIGDNRYGGGYVASLLVVGELDPIDTVFTGSDNEHGLGTSLLNKLGIPYYVADTPLEALRKLLAVKLKYDSDELTWRYNAFKKVVNDPKEFYRCDDEEYLNTVLVNTLKEYNGE